MANKPEDIARESIDKRLTEAGWVIQDMKELNPSVSVGVAVREFPTSSGPVDYALFVNGKPVGVVEAKRDEAGANITSVEQQSSRYANSKFKYIKYEYRIRFAYEATGVLTRFTDYDDIDYRSRQVFSFHQPKTLAALLRDENTVRNNLKGKYPFDSAGFRSCQIDAIKNLDDSFAKNKSHALVHMATGAGKTFTAITSAYRLLKFGKMKRILFLVDTKGLGQQAEREFQAYRPNDDHRSFSQLYEVHRLTRSSIPKDVQVCICTIQRMYSILKGEELDESAEEMTLESYSKAGGKKRREVVYNHQYPPEFFDCIIVDECHRSIYDVWSQVLEYFDSFIIGLTATPDKRTYAFFKNNVVSEYSREQAIIDGVNVGEDVFVIETEVSKNGGYIMRQEIEKRNRLTREKRWDVLEDDVEYDAKSLDRDVVNPSQIRTVIKTFADCWQTHLFPDREELPKTLVFAKTDSHADDIIQIIREEFGKGNEFCQKITYSAANPEQTLSDFRSSYNPRVAVTVDMISAGTDVKPIECLLFMRDVRSSGYFEQMKGRGTRTISKDDLQKVSPSAKENKDHFVIVDAVGVMKSRKTETRTLERKPSVSLKELMQGVALGNRDEDSLTSLANRLIRLNAKLSPAERVEFAERVGSAPNDIASDLLNVFDEDAVFVSACSQFDTKYPTENELDEARSSMMNSACSPFSRPEVREYIENVRRSHDQVIDSVNIDSLTYAGFDVDHEKHAKEYVLRFEEFVERHKDEIAALQIIYDAGYVRRPLVISELKELAAKMEAENMTVSRLWDCYAKLRPEGTVKRRSSLGQIADLVSLVRFACGATDSLEPFSDVVNYNFMRWTLLKNAGPVHFTDEQMAWLRLIRDHIASSLSVIPDDLDLSPFDKLGGLGRFYELFGDSYEAVLSDMNAALVV